MNNIRPRIEKKINNKQSYANNQKTNRERIRYIIFRVLKCQLIFFFFNLKYLILLNNKKKKLTKLLFIQFETIVVFTAGI